MTRSLTRSDLEEIEDFFNEFANADEGEADLLGTEASIDTLITQLEASAETAATLMEKSSGSAVDLREQVQSLAQRLERVAMELAEINTKLQ